MVKIVGCWKNNMTVELAAKWLPKYVRIVDMFTKDIQIGDIILKQFDVEVIGSRYQQICRDSGLVVNYVDDPTILKKRIREITRYIYC